MTVVQRWFGAHRSTGLRAAPLFLVGLLAASDHLGAQTNYTPYAFTTLAGRASDGAEDGPGTIARFFQPADLAVDRAGNAYVADTGNHTIRKVAPDGTVTTLAGLAGVAGSADGIGSAARFSSPQGIAVDALGTVYVADTLNYTIRRVTSAGVVTTLAGQAGAIGFADGSGSAARFNNPLGIAVDASGDVFVADSWNGCIRRVTSLGVVTTVAVTPGTSSDRPLSYPAAVAVDATGILYVADWINYRVCRITPDGALTPLRLADGTVAPFDRPESLTVDAAGNVYVPDPVSREILRLTPAGDLTNLATLPSAENTDSTVDIAGVAVDPLGNLLVADTLNSTILRLAADGAVSTVAGRGPAEGSADGTGAAARFRFPVGLAVDAAGGAYVADSANHTIRKISSAGVVSTLAGLAGIVGAVDGTGSAARFNYPSAVAVDGGGNLYVADSGNYTVRKITPGGVVTTLAGLAGSAGSVDGSGTTARFLMPQSVAVDGSGNLYVGDEVAGSPIPKPLYSAVIRKISPEGDVSTFARLVTTNTLHVPPATNISLAVDPAGNVYAAIAAIETMRGGSSAVYKVTPDGTVSGFAGQDHPFRVTSIDGVGGNAWFMWADSVATDAAGNVYVTDDNCVRRITPAGVVATLAGLSEYHGSTDGVTSSARFYFPMGLAVDHAGRVYVADTYNQTIRVGVAAGPPVITTQPLSLSVASGGTAQFSVAVSGVPEPKLQWYRNGAVLANGTAATLTLAGALASDAGDYTVTATNDLGSVTSNKATLTVMAAGGSGAGTAAAGGGGGIAGWFVLALALLAIGRWADGGWEVRRLAWRRRAPDRQPNPES